MRSSSVLLIGVAVGIAVAGLVGGLFMAQSAQAQYLAKFQNVTLDFEMNGNSSALTFFDRDSGDVYIYVASGSGGFQFAHKLSVTELGGPMSAQSLGASTIQQLPQRPTGTESDF